MRLSKEVNKEVLQVYDTWLHSYLNGDVETYNLYFDDDYHFIGSTNNEEFLNRKNTTNFFKATADQLSGKTALRNETKTIEQFGEIVFITHLFDAWFHDGNEWVYYSRFRFTNAMRKNAAGWRFIYQHYSTPDLKAQDGETIGYDQVSAENQQLREAVKRRTTELELKNRELEIESALERVRAQVTGMEKSEDLLDIVVTMRKEFVKLGHQAHYFWHMRWHPDKYEKAMTSGDGTRIGMVMELPRRIHGEIPKLAAWEKSDEPTVVFTMDVEATFDYIHKMTTWGDFQNIDPNMPTEDDIRHIGGLTYIMARTSLGEIGYSLPGIVSSVPKTDLDILVRFARAFDLAHKRFEDLKTRERQVRETQIELALEKLRSRTMAMQHSDELVEASALLDSQVRALGIETWGCAFNIYGENESSEWFSTKAGLMPPYKTPRENFFKRLYDLGQNGGIFHIEEFADQACVEHYEYLCTLPEAGEGLRKIRDSGGSFPAFQIDHIAYFKHGYLLFVTFEPVPEAHDIFTRFARVFEQTYTRFLDLQKAEGQSALIKEEKERLEKTLRDLQLTQKQLIQSEKMASLGELTAGIAHEIQNPLNFVNNFSEVSSELLDEMNEEIEKGELDEVKAIAHDIKLNLQKINHHGNRADAIVKGMLLHSRKSTADRTPTDINKLADEYLRLAYHGLRAKDKFQPGRQAGFNATLNTDFDSTLKKVLVIPQEIGRVILNLITNAFYAVQEKENSNGKDYQPTVTVSTKAIADKIIITVKDNGNGIPQKALDKIFQPFFTTKPTGQGTGLGLSLSYDIVKAHEGKLEVETEEGAYTAFKIILPK